MSTAHIFFVYCLIFAGYLGLSWCWSKYSMTPKVSVAIWVVMLHKMCIFVLDLFECLGVLIIPPATKFRRGILDSPCSSVRLSVCLSVRPLKLNQENKNDDKATFLDLEEQIKDACIEVKTYDKRDAFKFEIINYPDLSGNIPTKPAYGVFTSQVIRYARICSKKVDLLERVKSLTKKLLRKHYTINGLKSSLKKCLKKHRWITTKLGPRLHQNLTEE